MKWYALPLLAIVITQPMIGQFEHVFLLVEENHDYASIVGDTINAPYLNGLLRTYGLATNYYAVTHPSIGNYFMLTTGQIVTNNDGYKGTFTGDNIVRQMESAGISWKAYAEGYPNGSSYYNKHNVFVFFSDIKNDTSLQRRIVDAPVLTGDIEGHTLPRFGLIVPDQQNDAHDGTLLQADKWAQAHLTPLIESPEFQADGLLIITFDESASDNAYGGGKVCTIIVSTRSRHGYKATTFYQHQSVLRLAMKSLGMSTFPGAAAGAADMDEFFLPASVHDASPTRAGALTLNQNYPNPFNPSTTIEFRTGKSGNAMVRVYDTLGRELTTLFDGYARAGEVYTLTWDATSVASGMYVYELRAGGLRTARRMLLAK